MLIKLINDAGQWKDLMGHTVTYPNGIPIIGTGKFGEQCPSKDGVNNISIAVPTTREFAISAFLKINKYNTNWYMPIGIGARDYLYFRQDTGSLVYYTLAGVGSPELTKVVAGTWYHIYICVSSYREEVYLNGEKKISLPITNIVNLNQFSVLGGSGYNNGDGAVSDFTVWEYARPFSGIPTSPIQKLSTLYIAEDKSVYQVPFKKVADNWDSLSTADKENLFNNSSDMSVIVEQLRELGKFRVATFGKENVKSDCFVIATPKPQVVVPKDLLNIKQVEDITKISVTSRVLENKNRIQVTSLMHFDVDYSDIYSGNWTATTGVGLTTDKKFGERALKLSDGQLVLEKEMGFSVSDFTTDFWVKADQTQTSINPVIVTSSNVNLFSIQTNKLMIDGASYTLNTPLSDNLWHHVALVRQGGNFYLYVDGQKVKEVTDKKSTSISIKYIGSNTSGYTIQAIVDEFNVVPYAKWTKNFTPPTEPYKYNGNADIKNDIRFAFTVDKNKYYTIENGDWAEIQTDEIPKRGISYSSIDSISTNLWHDLITDKNTKVSSKLGIAFSLSQKYGGDTVSIDNLTLTINQKGKWVRSAHPEAYGVEYVDNETVKVTLNGTGSYKINYALG